MKSLAYNDWIFNAWGNKYDELKRDNAIPAQLEGTLGGRRFEPGIVMEGGSIEVNGDGIVMTTEQCLLNPNRNPDLDRVAIEDYLKNYLGVQQVLWLGEGIVGDDTDGHIDDIARFVAPDTIVCALEGRLMLTMSCYRTTCGGCRRHQILQVRILKSSRFRCRESLLL